MTRKEKIEKEAKVFAEEQSIALIKPDDEYAFIKGAEWGYNHAIERACEWLEYNGDLYCDDIDMLHLSALIGDFKYVMKQ